MALISKASLLMVPSTYEQEKLYNVLPSGNRAPDSTGENSGYDQTRADFTFDRGSNAAATRVNSEGLIEKYRENLLLQSNNFSDSVWTKESISVTSGQSGYDGSLNASLLKGNTNNAQHRIYDATSSASINTLSVYVKASGHNYIQILSGSSASQYANFDLSDGSLGSNGSAFIPSIQSVGSGWYRISAFNRLNLNRLYIQLVSSKTSPFNEAFAMPNDTDGVLIQNAQAETSMVATDYLDSGATTAKAGVLIDLPRINYDANGENGSLLLEPSRQQLFQYSEYFGGWTANASAISSVVDNYATSPEGIKNAAKIDFIVQGDSDLALKQSHSVTGGSTYTYSIYIKGEGSDVGKDIVIKSKRSGGDPAGTTTIQTLTAEWKKIDFSTTYAANNTSANLFISSNDATSVLVYGAQTELGSYSTSYIPNHGESGGVTRAADSITSGTITAPLSDGYTAFIELETQSTSVYNQIQFRETAANYVLRIGNQINVGAGSTIQTNTTGMNKFALQVSSGGAYELFKNGSSVATGTGITHDIELIKTDLAGQGVKQIAVFNEALTDAECITLTTL